MWRSLKNVYEKRGLSGQLFLRRKLMKLEKNARRFSPEIWSCSISIEDRALRLKRKIQCAHYFWHYQNHMKQWWQFWKICRSKYKSGSYKGEDKGGEEEGDQQRKLKWSNQTDYLYQVIDVANYNCGEYFKKDCKKLIQGQIIEVETILITKLEIGEEQIMMKHIEEIEIKTMETLNFDPDISNMKIIDYI